MSIQPRVINAWEGVISSRGETPGGVDVVYGAVNEDITSHADAIFSLKLSETVLRPISLQQIKREKSFVDSLTVYTDTLYTRTIDGSTASTQRNTFIEDLQSLLQRQLCPMYKTVLCTE
jgi:hypothetical protein